MPTKGAAGRRLPGVPAFSTSSRNSASITSASSWAWRRAAWPGPTNHPQIPRKKANQGPAPEEAGRVVAQLSDDLASALSLEARCRSAHLPLWLSDQSDRRREGRLPELPALQRIPPAPCSTQLVRGSGLPLEVPRVAAWARVGWSRRPPSCLHGRALLSSSIHRAKCRFRPFGSAANRGQASRDDRVQPARCRGVPTP